MAIDSRNTVELSKTYDNLSHSETDLCRSFCHIVDLIPSQNALFWQNHSIVICNNQALIGSRALENLDLIQALYVSASKSQFISLKDKIDLREKIKALFVSRNRFFIDPSILVPLLIIDSEGKSASIFLQVDRVMTLPFFQKLLFANFAEHESLSKGGSAKILLPELTNIHNFIHYLYYHEPKELHEIIQLFIIADYLADFEVSKKYLELLIYLLPTTKDDLLTVLKQSPFFSEPIANLYYSCVFSKYIQACLVEGGINEEVRQSFFDPHVREILAYTTLQLKISDGKIDRQDLLFLESVIPKVSLLNVAYCEMNDLPPVWQNTLEYINISYTQIQTIPAGFTFLKEFAALCCYSLRDISGLSHLQKLEKIIAQHTLISSAPFGCTSLQIFDVYSCSLLEDISGLDHLPNLKQIDISCSRVQRAPIGCKSLEIFGAFEANLLSNTIGLNNLEFLKDLDISETLATNAPVGCLNLEKFSALDAYHLRDISGLDGLPKLKEIHLSQTPIQSAPHYCLSLEIFEAKECHLLQDISGLDNLSHLTHVDISGTLVERAPVGCPSLASFKALTAPYLNNILGLNYLGGLKEFIVSHANITHAPLGCLSLETFFATFATNLVDISALNSLTHLQNLVFTNTQVTEAPRNCKSLEIFQANQNPLLSDISGLSHLPKLRLINVENTAVRSAPVECSLLREFHARNAHLLSDISGLKGCRYLSKLDIEGTPAKQNHQNIITRRKAW